MRELWKRIVAGSLLFVVIAGVCFNASATSPRFRVLVVREHDPNHAVTADTGVAWTKRLAADSNFVVDVVANVDSLSDAFLAKYQLFFQLNWPPFRWTVAQENAFIKFIEAGNGWIGFHTCGLTGSAVLEAGTHDWLWYKNNFFGGAAFVSHPAFQSASVIVEDRTHPVTKNLPANFRISDEWYEFDKNPRPSVRVLARVDESTYNPNKRATNGDHPMVWSVEKYSRVLYIGMGHSKDLYKDVNFQNLLRTAIMWAATPATKTKGPASPEITEKNSFQIQKHGKVLSIFLRGQSAFSARIMDANGKVVLQQSTVQGSLRINRGSLAVGVYTVRANSEHGVYSKRIVID
jgi:uncharacterized protein